MIFIGNIAIGSATDLFYLFKNILIIILFTLSLICMFYGRTNTRIKDFVFLGIFFILYLIGSNLFDLNRKVSSATEMMQEKIDYLRLTENPQNGFEIKMLEVIDEINNEPSLSYDNPIMIKHHSKKDKKILISKEKLFKLAEEYKKYNNNDDFKKIIDFKYPNK